MTTTESQSSSSAARTRVSAFKPKAFEASTWQVISESTVVDAFEPLKVTTVDEGPCQTDPMFDDYSEIPPAPPMEQAESDLIETVEEVFEESVEEWVEDGVEATVGVSALQELEQRYQEEISALQAEHEKQLEAIRTEAYEQGKSEAHLEGQTQLQALETNYASLIEDMNAQIVERLGEVERQAVDFSLHVAKKLVGVTVEANPEYIVPLIKEAIQLTGGATIKAIRVSVQDLELINKLMPERQFKEFDGTWSFVADETIRHGCVVETNAGSAEYDLEKAWERVKDQVLKVR
jgi:flagellar biosynthesis/type III secretory pathway protein FliH